MWKFLTVLLVSVVSNCPRAQSADDVPPFPLKSPLFEKILDKLPDNSSEAQHIEFKVLEFVLSAVKAADSAAIEKAAEELTYNKLFTDIEKLRGHVRIFNGEPSAFQKITLPRNSAAISEIWVGQVSLPKGQLITLLSLEPVAEGKSITATGVVFKRFAYLNRMPGRKLTWTLLAIAKSALVSPGAKPILPDEVTAKLPREIWSDDVIVSDPLIVQLREKDGEWIVELNGRSHTLRDLLEVLDTIVQDNLTAGLCRKDATGAVSLPAKLRIPEHAPMKTVEDLVVQFARVGMVNVQYLPLAANNVDPENLSLKKGAPKEKVAVHVRSLNGEPLFRAEDKDLKLAGLEAFLAEKSKSERAIQVRVSYEADTLFGDVYLVFKTCTSTGIYECGLIPLRGPR